MTTIEPRTSVVTIYQGDYLDRIRHVERQFLAAVESEKSTSHLMADATSPALADEHAALVAEAEATALHITLKALGRKVWRGIVADNPPRKDNRDDIEAGVNEEAFRDVLVPLSIVEPELTEDELDQLSDVDYERLYLTAFGLNRFASAAPKSLVSPLSQQSDETSN